MLADETVYDIILLDISLNQNSLPTGRNSVPELPPGIMMKIPLSQANMFAKCQYLDELTGGKGVTFATGTPISNSMTELYTNMRYLQYGTLQKLGLGHFDSWASSFGETQTAIEFAQVL